ncbi:MAG: DUF3052 family protein [Propionibacteriales bacterium]|nr:DUF3052 family protein [Propionibacteriales bacterium]
MSSTVGGDGSQGAGVKLGFKPDMVVQELGWDEDVDDDLRTAIEAATGSALVDEDHGDVVDAVLLWWREDDGDLFNGLVDALTDLADGGAIWLLTPKVGRDGHVEPSEIAEAAPTAGLSTTTSLAVGPEWAATKLVAPKSGNRR